MKTYRCGFAETYSARCHSVDSAGLRRYRMWDSRGIMLSAKLLLSIYLSLARVQWKVESQLTDCDICDEACLLCWRVGTSGSKQPQETMTFVPGSRFVVVHLNPAQRPSGCCVRLGLISNPTTHTCTHDSISSSFPSSSLCAWTWLFLNSLSWLARSSGSTHGATRGGRRWDCTGRSSSCCQCHMRGSQLQTTEAIWDVAIALKQLKRQRPERCTLSLHHKLTEQRRNFRL